jgi:hypothetical protein
VHRALARIPKQEADQAREAQRARLQAVRMLLWNQASADPIRAAEALIKLEAREARLLGLDMPTKVAVTDPDGGIPLETIRRVMERVDRQMVDVTPEPAFRLLGSGRIVSPIVRSFSVSISNQPQDALPFVRPRHASRPA